MCDCEDLETSESEVAKLVASIEMEMFDIFRNTDSKYMNKYRTIMFNLKDSRNKVCSKLIKPSNSQYCRNLYSKLFLGATRSHLCI